VVIEGQTGDVERIEASIIGGTLDDIYVEIIECFVSARI